MGGLEIRPIAAFEDNYIWLLQRPGCEQVAVVDPGDEEPVLALLAAEGLQLGAILLTHKHGDHTGGVADLRRHYPAAEVYGPVGEPIATITCRVHEGDRVSLPFLGVELQVLEVPGHTEGHVAYYGEGALFCGDTLFAAGCGRVFSGTHDQLHHSLQRLAGLPAETRVYCAHEYTQANIGFALWVEPDNPAVQRRAAEIAGLRAASQPTLPSTIELELETNPFMRTQVAGVIRAAEGYAGRELITGAEVFTAIRTWKDKEYD